MHTLPAVLHSKNEKKIRESSDRHAGTFRHLSEKFVLWKVNSLYNNNNNNTYTLYRDTV